jgi:hypothetical protein
MIDLVAGTGAGTGAPIVSTNSYGKQEVDKDPALSGQTEPASEGDPDYASDSSRILVSENSNVDQTFPTAVESINLVDASDKTGPSIVARSQHIRVIASNEGTVRITVEGPSASSILIDAVGNVQINSEATISIQSSKILLGTTSPSSATGVLVGEAGIKSILIALRNDLLGFAAAGVPPSPVAVAALPSVTSAFTALGLTAEADPTLASLFSKTVFASS